MTIRQLAKLVHVSPSTASKALAGSKEVSRETIEMVRRAAEETGYIKTLNKRRRDSRRKNAPNIALLVPEIMGAFYPMIISYLTRLIGEYGGTVYIRMFGFDPDEQLRAVMSTADNGSIDGMITIFCTADVRQVPIPVVNILEVRDDYGNTDSVHTNLKKGLYDAVEYLRGLGHRRIGFIGEPLTDGKQSYFLTALRDCGVELNDSDIIISEGRFEKSGSDAASRILRSRDRATAYICAYDEIAVGAIKEFEASGFKVPGDFSVVGINDIPTSSYMGRPLTTIRSNIEEICSISLSLLLNKVNDGEYRIIQHINVDSNLVIRDTTAPPKGY